MRPMEGWIAPFSHCAGTSLPNTSSVSARRWRNAASAALTGGVALLFSRVLVANWSDNAYLLIALAGWALQLPAALFLAAAIVPVDPVRRWASRAAIVLVWLIGALTLVPLPFILYALGVSAIEGQAGEALRGPVARGHLLAGIGAVLLVAVVGWYLPRQLPRHGAASRS